MFNEQNLLSIHASDHSRYACKLLDQLFSKEEQAIGHVEPTDAGAFATLDKEKLKILKGKFYVLKL